LLLPATMSLKYGIASLLSTYMSGLTNPKAGMLCWRRPWFSSEKMEAVVGVLAEVPPMGDCEPLR